MMKGFGLVALLAVLGIAGYLMIGGGDGNGGPSANSQLGQAKAAKGMEDKARAAMAIGATKSVQEALDSFEASKQRKAASLDELVSEGFMQSVPGGLVYDPATGKVSSAP